MAKIICNSSPIIGFSLIGKLNLLWEIFDEVYIPEAVYQEVVSGNRTPSGVKIRSLEPCSAKQFIYFVLYYSRSISLILRNR